MFVQSILQIYVVVEPFEKTYLQKWESYPNRGERKEHLKPSPRILNPYYRLEIFNCVNQFQFHRVGRQAFHWSTARCASNESQEASLANSEKPECLVPR